MTKQNAIPSIADIRKSIPVYSGFIRYFPDAIAEVAELSGIGNEQHNPGTPLHWDRSKSGDELDALARHLVDAGKWDTDGVRHSAKIAWRALANLQKEIEREHEVPFVCCTYATDGIGLSFKSELDHGATHECDHPYCTCPSDVPCSRTVEQVRYGHSNTTIPPTNQKSWRPGRGD